MDDLVAMHRVALGDLDALAATVDERSLARPTPCEGWLVADLLAHSIGQHRGFAAAVRDGEAGRAAYDPVTWGSREWRDSVRELLAEFAGADVSASVLQVELDPTNRTPMSRVIGAQLLDSAVHAWDLARALGADYEPAEAVCSRVLAIAERIPDGASREADGAAFRHAVGEEGEGWRRVLGLLGRDPRWAL